MAEESIGIWNAISGSTVNHAVVCGGELHMRRRKVYGDAVTSNHILMGDRHLDGDDPASRL